MQHQVWHSVHLGFSGGLEWGEFHRYLLEFLRPEIGPGEESIGLGEPEAMGRVEGTEFPVWPVELALWNTLALNSEILLLRAGIKGVCFDVQLPF